MLHRASCSYRWVLRLCAWWVALALALSMPLTANAAGQIPAQNMTLLGSYGGKMNAVTVADGYAYIGQGATVAIAGVVDPTQPKLVGHSQLLPGMVTAIAVHQSYLYATLGRAGLAVLDVHDRANPVVVEVLDVPGTTQDVVVPGTVLVVASGLAGLRTFDISDPAQPHPLGALNTPGFARRLVADDNTLYIADGDSGLRIVDISAPATPVDLGSFDTAGDTGGVAYGDHYVYLADGYNLRVIDVSNPSQPIEASALAITYPASDVILANGYLYALMSGYVYIFDGEPLALNQVANFLGTSTITDMDQAGNDFYFTEELDGLSVVDVSSPDASKEVGLLAMPGRTESVAASGDIVYMTRNFRGVTVLDESQPAQIAHTTNPGGCSGFVLQATVAANKLIVDATYPMGGRSLCFSSLTDPRAPQWLGERPATEGVGRSPRLATRGNLIVVADSWNGVTVLNADDPLGAPLATYSPTTNGIGSVATPSNSNLLVAESYDRLWFADLSTPTAPQTLGEYPGNFGAADGTGDLLVVYNDTSKRLDILDIHTPSVPQVVANMELPGDFATQVVVVSNLVWVANGSAGVRVIDISTPDVPKEVAFFDPPDAVSGLALAGHRVYVAAGDAGLLVLQFHPPGESSMLLPRLAR